jgi:hypothetical protein
MPRPPAVPPGYRLIGASDPPAAAPRSAGRGVGLYALVHESIVTLVSREPATSARCLWLRVRRGAGPATDLFVDGGMGDAH